MNPERSVKLLKHLSRIPNYMLKMHNQDNLVEFVLHELCRESGLNIDRAAYLIDNADFDFVKGIAGFDKKESYDIDDIWNNCQAFTEHMRRASFANKVRSFEQKSPIKQLLPNQDLVTQLSDKLELKNPQFCVWPVRNDNVGIFVYQTPESGEEHADDVIETMSLLGFCPVF